MSARCASKGARFGAAIWRGALGLGLLVAANGCYWTANVATFSPLKTSYPVSASPQYIDGDGTIVTENQYQVVAPFEFTHTVEGPRHEETETRINLEPNLDPIVAKAQGDAVTHMKIDGAEYRSGSHGSSGGLKLVGWSFSLLGGMALTVAAVVTAGDHPERATLLWGMGGATAGAGVLCFVFSALANDPSVWRLHVSGNVVRRNSDAAPPAPSEPPPVNAALSR
jgi:hypothetical protein